MPTDQDIADQYGLQRTAYESLAESAATTITTLLRARKVDYLAVVHRTKTIESVREKVSRKGYADLVEFTDLAGVRVITYIESDIAKVSGLLNEAFVVDAKHSIDKSEELSDDQFGYRSVHFVCELGDARTALPELSELRGLKFEVQVRTVLQHAWAEIEHDRSYKFAGELPSAIKRRLNLLAGVLELADREFGLLAREVDEYATSVKQSAASGSLSEEELTSISLSEFFKSDEIEPKFSKSPYSPTSIDEVVGELKRFGVVDIAGVKKLLSPKFMEALATSVATTTVVGLMRKAMMFEDVDRYFSDAWKTRWLMSPDTHALLKKRYGAPALAEVLKRHGVRRQLKTS